MNAFKKAVVDVIVPPIEFLVDTVGERRRQSKGLAKVFWIVTDALLWGLLTLPYLIAIVAFVGAMIYGLVTKDYVIAGYIMAGGLTVGMIFHMITSFFATVEYY